MPTPQAILNALDPTAVRTCANSLVTGHWGGVVANVPPVAAFTSSATGLAVSFVNTSTDSDGTIVARAWTFGDGTTSALASPSKTYSTAGTYTVSLTVTDNGGATNTVSRGITVAAGTNVAPTASFTRTITGLTVAFTSTSTDSDGTIASYAWTFGDATTSTLANPSHTYSTAGTYTVGLTVTDNGGLTGTTSQSVTVAAALLLDGLDIVAGDSIANGYGDSANADPGLAIAANYVPARFVAKRSTGTTDPMVFVDTIYGDLRAQGAAGTPNMGPELSFGRYMNTHGGDAGTTKIVKFTINGVALGGAQGFLPAATFPATNIYTSFIAFVDAQVTATAKPVRSFTFSLGTNDAANTTLANAFSANMTTFASALRTKYGANIPIILRLVNGATAGAFIATVRSQATSWVAGDGNAVLVNIDHVPPNPSDGIHPDANGHISEGNTLALALANKLRPTRSTNQAATANPWMQAFYEPGIFTTGVQNVAPKARMPDARAGDLQVLVYQNYYQNAVPTLTTANGFVALTGAQAQSLGAGNYTNAKIWTRAVLQVDLDAAGGRLADPVFTDNSDELLARCFVIRGPAALTAANIEQVATGSVGATTGTPMALNSPTNVTVAAAPAVPRLVLTVASALWGGTGTGQLNGQAQTGVTGLTEVQDSSWIGSVAKMTQSVYTAIAAAGATVGGMTGTYDASSYTVNTSITLVIAP